MSITSAEISQLPELLISARKGDQNAFQSLAEPYRREIQLHCYRMLGSLQDAEDLVQETFLRAWRGLSRFEGRGSVRGWLYRIATNACLNILASRKSARRVMPEIEGPPSVGLPDGTTTPEIPGIEPYPDTALEGIADTAPGPHARYEMREAVHLAFIAAIQYLPPRQRAVLLLCDAMGWSAAETAQLLDTSVASINSVLQRARETLKKRHAVGMPAAQPADDHQRALLDRYVRTWENFDLNGFVALLKEDAILSMPPLPQWYQGREAIRSFMAWAWSLPRYGAFRVVPTAANGQPALALYSREPDGNEFHAHSIHVLTLRDDAIAVVTLFRDPQLFAAFGLPAVL